MIYRYCSKKNSGAFHPEKLRSKMDFPLYFQKVILVGGGSFYSETAKHPGTSFGGNVGKT